MSAYLSAFGAKRTCMDVWPRPPRSWNPQLISVGMQIYAGLFHADAGSLDHLAHLFCFVGQEVAELLGRHRQRNPAEVFDSRLDLIIVECGSDLLIERRDDRGGRTGGRTDAVPLSRFESRHCLADGRNFGH